MNSVRTRVADVLSDVSSPVVQNTIVCLVLGIRLGSPIWAVVLALASGILPGVVIGRGMRRGEIADRHVSRRRERTLVMLTTLGGLAACWLVEAIVGASNSIQYLTSTYTIFVGALCLITIRWKWKISAHAGSAACNAVLAIAVFGPALTVGLPAVPLVMWARVAARGHTPAQTLAGATVGAVVPLVLYGLFR
jgi:hypothetical protein